MDNATPQITPPVSACGATECTYNVGRACHAKAITIGDGNNPNCDTFFSAGVHSRNVSQVAGVGACKVSSCKFNNDFECSARSIVVDHADVNARCLTFKPS